MRGASVKTREVLEKKELEVLASGIWGTIGPYSVSCAARLAELAGARRGLLCHSADAALEAVYRHFSLWRGRTVLVGAVSMPSDARIAALLGASVRFVDVADPADGAQSEDLAACLSHDKPDAVVLDVPTRTDAWPLDELSALCRDAGVPLILNAGGRLRVKWRGRPLAGFADAVCHSLEKGSELYAGKGGLVVTDSDEVFDGAFAYHNCGRAFGEGCTLKIDGYVGGDLRVSEWTACAAQVRLEAGDFDEPAAPTYVNMTEQPLFASRR